tara:strand:- start:3451 stop:3738 length:288 start_codon:yes stop_codon:yes gene_type:complete
MNKFLACILTAFLVTGCMNDNAKVAFFPGPQVGDYNGKTVSIIADGTDMEHKLTNEIKFKAWEMCRYAGSNKKAKYISYQQKPSKFTGTYLFNCK